MLISKTFATVTPESAEVGDYASHGYVAEDVECSLRDARHDIRDIGAHYLNDCDDKRATVYGDSEDTNYRTGEVTTYALHFKFRSPAESRAFRKLCKLMGVKS